MELRIGRRIFAPSWPFTLLALLVFVVFVSLGRWQWQRAGEKRDTWSRFTAATEQARHLGTRSVAELPRYERIEVSGRFDARRQFLLDNRTLDGRPGYEVLTPLELEGGRTLLVNRGWLPFGGYRDRLPDIAFEAPARVTLTGRIDELPTAGLPSGRAAPSREREWPKLTSYPRMAELEQAFGRPLEPRVLLLDRGEPFGYAREWRPPGVPPERHWSYAIQWWSFAALLVVLYVVLNLRRVKVE